MMNADDAVAGGAGSSAMEPMLLDSEADKAEQAASDMVSVSLSHSITY